MRSLINRKAVREYALEHAKATRDRKFTRVSKEFYDDLEAMLRASISARVHRAPSVGKTL